MGLAQGHNAVTQVRLEPDKIACYMLYNADNIFKKKYFQKKKKNLSGILSVLYSLEGLNCFQKFKL